MSPGTQRKAAARLPVLLGLLVLLAPWAARGDGVDRHGAAGSGAELAADAAAGGPGSRAPAADAEQVAAVDADAARDAAAASADADAARDAAAAGADADAASAPAADAEAADAGAAAPAEPGAQQGAGPAAGGSGAGAEPEGEGGGGGGAGEARGAGARPDADAPEPGAACADAPDACAPADDAGAEQGGGEPRAQDADAAAPAEPADEVEGLLLLLRSSSPTLDFLLSDEEFMLDAAAWVGCTVTVLWLARKILIRLPRTCLSVALAWLGWFGCQVFVITGYPALEAAHDRGAAAFVATKKLVHALVETNKAWLHFFLPFHTDIFWWMMQVWQQLVQVLQKLSREQQLMLGCLLLAGYAMVEVYRMYGRHKENVKMVFFHGFFLVAAPVMLWLSGLLPRGWLPSVLGAAVTLVPTGFSLWVLADPPKPPQWGGSPRHKGSSYETAQQRRWLSYWACWPILQVCTIVLPSYVSFFTTQPDVQDLFYRAALVLVIWLQFWQGSRLLSFSMQGILRVLFNESVLDYCASWLGEYGKKALQVARGGLSLTCSWSLFSMMGLWRSMKRLWLWAAAALAGVVLLVALAMLFSRTLALASKFFVVLLWCFVAIDSVDTLDKHDADLIAGRLSFWVLAMLWEPVATIPYIGVIVRMFTPIAFCLFLVAGQVVLRRGVLPIVRWMQVPVGAAAGTLRAALPAVCGSLLGTLRSGMREMDRERPAGEERGAPEPKENGGATPLDADDPSARRSSGVGDTGGVGGDADEAADEAAGAAGAGAEAQGGATGGLCSPAAAGAAEPGEGAKEGGL